ITAVSSHCGVFGSRKLWFHEETLSSAERTQSALIRNGVKRPNVVGNFIDNRDFNQEYNALIIASL
ncbi:hypothetical protein, partial [Flavobacterium caeni]|uniref:hypothetical protein n=1 Tax=Flavobacterium caeni TaxID=490189 RepID=UPI001B8AD2ED